MADIPVSRKLMKRTEEEELNDLAQNSLEESSSCQSELEIISKRMMNRIISVVQEFMILKKPLYNKRHTALKNVPHFWAISFINHPKLKLLVDNGVEDCFNYLTHIQVIENDDIRSGYRVIFTFDTNPYFYNLELIKQNVFENNVIMSLKTNIDWKENMNISSERLIKGKKRGPPVENFFDWLQRSSNNKIDYVCEMIKDDLWIDPLKFFFLPDDAGDDNSESESEEDEEYDNIIDSNDDDSHDDDMGEGDDNIKQGTDSST